MKHSVKKGLIFSKKGIPASPRWFADNRLAFQFDATGVTRVEYRNPMQKEGNPIVFLRGIHDGFRYYLEQNGATYRAEFTNTTVWPFGIESEWPYGAITLKHFTYAAGDSIVIRLVTPPSVPAGLRFKLEFNEPFAFIPAEQSNFLYSGMGATRCWDKWEYQSGLGALKGRYVEQLNETRHIDENDIRVNGLDIDKQERAAEAVLDIFIGADFPLEHVKRCSKHILFSPELEGNREYHFVTMLIPGEDGIGAAKLFRTETANIKDTIQKQYDRYQKVIRSSPQLNSPYKALNDFISLAPLYHEQMKVTGRPGAIRAKTSNYWVWGWDGLTSNSATLYWGDAAFIRDMLHFYETTAHPEMGIAHAYRNDMVTASICDLPAQGMYITLLHQYYSVTKDLKGLMERYPFAKKIYQRISASEVNGTGFCMGTSLFPDFPVFMKETGKDISAFNNTVFYCASRSMEFLASLLGDEEMSATAAGMFGKIENNFTRLFFHEGKGFIANSIDAVTLQKRDCYSANAVKWENDYCSELYEGINNECMKFFADHFVSKAGIRPMPVWDSAFDADANQLHSWWPVMGEYYMKLINGDNRVDLMERWIGWVSYWTEKLTIPEGIPCYIDTDEPEHDRWDTLCGTWQSYSVRGWYQAVLHGIVGVGIDMGGLVFFPYEGREMELKGLHFMDKTIDVEMCGSGCFIESVDVDGVIVKGTNRLPVDLLEGRKHIKIRVQRTKENPYKVYIKYANGLELAEYRYEDGILAMKIRGSGTSRMKLVTSGELLAKLEGEPVNVLYNHKLRLATLEVNMQGDEVKELEVLF